MQKNSQRDGRRIALFLTSLAGGGAERVMLNLARGIGDAGHEVDLVVTRASGPLASEVPRPARLVDLGARRIIASLPSLARYLGRERPQAMLSALAPANCVAVWARSLACVPMRLILSEHNSLSHAAEGASNWRGWMLPKIMRRTYPRADGLVAVSAGVAGDLAAMIGVPRDGIDVIYNPVITDEMLERSRESLDHPWFGAGVPPVVLGAGRLTAQKDFTTLIRAYALLGETREARLLILGEGEDRPRLEALVAELGLEETVSMPGFVSNPYAYMRQAAVFVLSSRWEGFGNVLAEAMACGAPVVSTDCPSGPAEILADGKFGELVPVGDSEALAAAIASAMGSDNPQAAKRATQFSIANATEKYLAALLP